MIPAGDFPPARRARSRRARLRGRRRAAAVPRRGQLPAAGEEWRPLAPSRSTGAEGVRDPAIFATGPAWAPPAAPRSPDRPSGDDRVTPVGSDTGYGARPGPSPAAPDHPTPVPEPAPRTWSPPPAAGRPAPLPDPPPPVPGEAPATAWNPVADVSTAAATPWSVAPGDREGPAGDSAWSRLTSAAAPAVSDDGPPPPPRPHPAAPVRAHPAPSAASEGRGAPPPVPAPPVAPWAVPARLDAPVQPAYPAPPRPAPPPAPPQPPWFAEPRPAPPGTFEGPAPTDAERPAARPASSAPAPLTGGPPRPVPPPPFVPGGQEWLSGRPTGTLTLAPDDAPPDRADDTPPGAPARRSSTRNAVEWVVIIGAALVAALVIKTYLLQAFYIPSPSMVPTLKIQDRVLVNKLSYRLHDVHRGDVVVFERPPNDAGTIRDLIKRVVGLAGDTVEGRDGVVYVNGRQLNEPYLPKGTVTSQFSPKTIPEGYIWVMGDNRTNSSDSRVFGAVDEDRIVGRAFVRVWPLGSLGLL